MKTREGEENPSIMRFAPYDIPEAKSLKTGVSVKYVPDSSKSWFVFRASYGRVDIASDYLVEDGTYTYVARRYQILEVNGKNKKILRPLIPNLLFVYTTKEKAEEYINKTHHLSFLSFYYNHFEVDKNHKNPPLIVPEHSMLNFIRATANMSEHLMFIDPTQCHFKGGESVIVTDGVFKGVEGKVARVSGQQRVIVSISGVGLISTAYIPSAFIKIIDDNNK